MYTRVFYRILDSSLNTSQVPVPARWLWLTMLLLGDEARTGIVDMPLERLASRAGLSVEDTRSALAVLMAPDPESRSDVEEGRRIKPIGENACRGWVLVNYDEYKAIANEEHQRELTRRRVKRHADRQKGLTNTNDELTAANDRLTETNTSEAESNQTKPKQTKPRKSVSVGFHAPQVEDVTGYWAEAGLRGNPREFFDHFGANGWKMRSGPVRDWRAAARNWSRRSTEFEVKQGAKGPSTPSRFESVSKGGG